MKFEKLVAAAAESVEATQRSLPPEIRPLAEAVPVHYEAEPDADVIAEGIEPDILGLFTGSAHGTEFSEDLRMPPQIILYINNLWDYAEQDLDVFREESRLTYLHELGHYLGWDEGQVSAHGLE